MPYTHGYANDFDDLISKVIAWSTDSDIHKDDAWELIRNEPWPRGTILKAHGFRQGEHFYVGLMPKVIEQGKTYKEWFLQKQVLASRFVWSPNGLKKPGVQFKTTGTGLTMNYDKSHITYTFSQDIDIFTNSAQALWMGIFKQYSPNLDWHEQPGGMNFEDLPNRPIYYSSTGSDNLHSFIPPVYPGAGYPAIGMDFNGPLVGYLEYWLTKDAHRLIIVTKNREYWDVAYLGFLEPYHNGEYAFPAAVIGGTSGAVMKGGNVMLSPNPNSVPSISTGIQFDYRTSNWALMKGIPAFSASPEDDNKTISQVRLMLPDGRWQSFVNWIQGETAYPNFSQKGKIISYTFVRDKPKRAENIGYYIRPTESTTIGTTHAYRPQGEILTYQIEPLEFVQGTGQVNNLFGRAWRMYWPSSRIAQYGELRMDGKLYLMIPNAWEGRRFSLSSGRLTSNDPDELFKEEAEIEALSRQMNCLIRLED